MNGRRAIICFLIFIIVCCYGCDFRRNVLFGKKNHRPDKKYLSLADVFSDVKVSSAPASQPAVVEKKKIVPKALLTFMEAKQEYLRHNNDKTIKLLKRVISEDSEYLPARELLLKIYVEGGKDSLARKQAEEILRIKPNHPFANYVLGSLFLRDKQYGLASRYLYIAYLSWRKEELQDEGRFLATLAKLAASLSAQGYMSAAIEVYVPLIDRLEKLKNDSASESRIERILQAGLPEFCMIVGEFAMRTGRYELAKKYFNKASEFAVMKKQAKLALVRCLSKTKETEQAKKVLDSIVKEYGLNRQTIELYKKFYPDNKWVKHILAIRGDNCDVLASLISLTDDRESVNSLAYSILRMFEDKTNAVCMTTILLRMTDKATGKKLLSALKSISPNTERERQAYTYLLAIAYQIAGDAKHSKALYANVVQAHRNYLPVYVAYGNLLLYMRDWDGIISLVESAPKELSSRASLLYLKGYALVQQGKMEQGTTILERAYKQAPQSERIALGLIDAYFNEGKYRLASSVLGNLIKDDSISGESLLRVVDLLLNMEQIKLARAIARRYRQQYGADIKYKLAQMKIIYFTNHDISQFRNNLKRIKSDELPAGLLAKERAQLEFDAKNYTLSAKIASDAYNSDELISPYIFKQLVRTSAVSYWKLLEYDKAEQSWKTLLKYWPNDRFKAALAQMYMDAREYGKAVALLEQLIDSKILSSKKSQLQMILVEALVRKGDLPKALSLINIWLKKAEPSERTRLRQLKLNAAILAKNFAKAEQLVKKFLADEQDSNKRKWERWFVMILLREHQAKRALNVIEQWAHQNNNDNKKDNGKQSNDNDERFFDGLKIPVLLAMHNYNQAIAIAEQLYKSANDEKKFSVAKVLIKCYQQAGKYNQAIELASKLLSLYKDNSLYAFSLHKDIITSLELAGKYTLAEDYLKTQIAKADNSMKTDWQQILVSLYFTANRIDKVIALLEQIVKNNPDTSWANNSLGYALALKGRDLKRADTLVRKALATDPGNASYLDSLAWVYYKQGKFSQAYKYAMMAYCVMDEDEPVLLDHLGDICYKLGKLKEAREYWQRAIARCKELTRLDLEPNMPDRIIRKLKAISSEDKRK